MKRRTHAHDVRALSVDTASGIACAGKGLPARPQMKSPHHAAQAAHRFSRASISSSRFERLLDAQFGKLGTQLGNLAIPLAQLLAHRFSEGAINARRRGVDRAGSRR